MEKKFPSRQNRRPSIWTVKDFLDRCY